MFYCYLLLQIYNEYFYYASIFVIIFKIFLLDLAENKAVTFRYPSPITYPNIDKNLRQRLSSDETMR